MHRTILVSITLGGTLLTLACDADRSSEGDDVPPDAAAVEAGRHGEVQRLQHRS